MSKQPPTGQKAKAKRLSIRRVRSPNIESSRHDGSEGPDSALPSAARERLWNLFEQIEREFENVYVENLTCEYKLIIQFLGYLLIITCFFRDPVLCC